MPRKLRSVPQRSDLERMMKTHLSFEINRFRNGVAFWGQVKYGVLADAMIRESCLLHFRLILEFFYPRGDPAKSPFEDIFVSDYLPDPSKLSAEFQKLLEEPRWLQEYRDMLDWRLAHLTRQRFKFEEPSHRVWNPREQFGHVDQLITEFLDSLDEPMRQLFDPARQG